VESRVLRGATGSNSWPKPWPAISFTVPPYVPHQEINASDDLQLHCVLARSGQQGLVVNLDIIPGGGSGTRALDRRSSQIARAAGQFEKTHAPARSSAIAFSSHAAKARQRNIHAHRKHGRIGRPDRESSAGRE